MDGVIVLVGVIVGDGRLLYVGVSMTEEAKLHMALIQVQNLMLLTTGNEYEKFLQSKLIGVQVELTRQLTNLTNSSKITE